MALRAIETFALRFLVRGMRLVLEQMMRDGPPPSDWMDRARKTLEYERVMKIEQEL